MTAYEKSPLESEGALGEQYDLPGLDEDSNTRDRALLQATVLFAQKGFAAASLKEIAAEIGIKAASLYNHFSSKEDLLNSAIDNAEELYRVYFIRLDEAIGENANFEHTVECMFVELLSVVHIFTYYCFSFVLTEQFRSEKAASIVNDLFLKYSIAFIRERFDRCVNNGTARPFDTETAATILMHTVLVGMQMRVQQDLNREMPYDPTEMFRSVQRFILEQGCPEE